MGSEIADAGGKLSPSPAKKGFPDEFVALKSDERVEENQESCDEFSDIEIEKKPAAPIEEEEEDRVQTPSPQNHHTDSEETAGVHSLQNIADVDSQIISNSTPIIRPNEQFPKPEAPGGIQESSAEEKEEERNEKIQANETQSPPETFAVDMPAIGKFIRDRSSSFSAAIAKRLYAITDYTPSSDVTEFDLPGMKVVVKQKDDVAAGGGGNKELCDLKGRISFFSRSNCRDCTAVRNFFRQRGLRFVEINIDVYPQREKELIDRTGTTSVPQIFFNENLFGGLVALNSLRNSGLFEQRLRELVGRKSSSDAPEQPVYGFDDPEDERTDEMIGIVRVLRQRLPIQDRLMKMKIVKNCFAGSEMVEVMIQHLRCGRRKAIDTGKMLAKKHFIHHVFWENDFDDGNHFYRFLEHEPFIPKCVNFRGLTNDYEPKPAAVLTRRINKIMTAILESYSSDDRHHVDYVSISNSEEFRRYVNLAEELHRLNLLPLSADERLAFFLNLHNAMVIHAIIRGGRAEGVIDRRSFFSDFQYLVGGYPYSLGTIKNGILRANQRPPLSLSRPFSGGDGRLELLPSKVNPLIHFGLCYGTRSSPTVRFFSPQSIESELRCATREFFRDGGIEINLDKRTLYLTRIIKWFNVDFGVEKDIPKWIINYLDASKAGLLMHLLSDGGPVNIVYQNYDWSINC